MVCGITAGQARLGDERPFHDQSATLVVEVVQLEGGVLCPNVDGQARRREEAVVLAIAPAEVGAAAMSKVEVRVLLHVGLQAWIWPRKASEV